VAVLLQIELHPLLAQRKLVGVSYRKGVVSVAHSCLVRQAPEIQESPLVQQVAAETGKTINQVGVSLGPNRNLLLDLAISMHVGS
jgi:diketogulonate reductase-like aldo/keto reductase